MILKARSKAARQKSPATPSLFFCVGAQKAGTTWLAENLGKHPELHFGPRKEVHYFDGLDGRDAPTLIRYSRKLKKALAKLPDKTGAAFDNEFRKVERYYRYLSIFDQRRGHARYLEFLRIGYKGGSYLCDFTPSYAMLEAERFADMAALRPDAKFLYILRDPVDRRWSSMRMGVANRAGKDSEPDPEALVRMARKFANGHADDDLGRSDYSRTIAALEAAVPVEQIHYEFFETLFTDEAIGRICAFLGIDPIGAALSEKVREGVGMRLPEEYMEGFLTRLAPQYAFCEEKFGAALPERWRARMALMQREAARAS